MSERLFTRYAYREVLEQHAADVIMTDVVWTGGITEAQKIAILADSFHLPITPHDCTGLVTLFANLHLSAASPNAMILETVRGFYEGWYRESTRTTSASSGALPISLQNPGWERRCETNS